MTAQKKLPRKRNSDGYREQRQRFMKPQTGLYSLHDTRDVQYRSCHSTSSQV